MPGECVFAEQLHFPVHMCVQITSMSPVTSLHRHLSDYVGDDLQLAAFKSSKHWCTQALEMPGLRVSKQEHLSLNQESALCF